MKEKIKYKTKKGGSVTTEPKDKKQGSGDSKSLETNSKPNKEEV